MKTKFFSLLTAFSLLGTTGIGISSLQASQTNKPSKPFLIQGKLPHLTGMVKMMWDDEDLALSPKQKKELLKIRKKTLTKAKSLNKQIIPLENEIVQKSLKGVAPQELEKDVKHLAQLRAEATMVHLQCIYNTRKVLTQEQIDILE